MNPRRAVVALIAGLALLSLVFVAGPASAAAPVVTVEAANNVEATTAQVEGTVNPEDHATSYRFEYVPQAKFEVNEWAEASHAGSGSLAEGAGVTPVSQELTNLSPHTVYHLRLVAENEDGPVSAAAPTFETAGAAPLVKSFAAGPVQPDAADLNGEVDPQGSSTKYWFEWGTKDCSSPGADCESLPADHAASAGEGQLYTYVSERLSNLSPGSTYHFRLVAENSSGTTKGPDEEFTTAAPELACANQGAPGTSFLPDCRAYEMVSPPEKGGLSVIESSFKTHVAADGNAVTFPARGGFGVIEGAAFDADYIARRTALPGTNGWATRGINPSTRTTTILALVGNALPTYEIFNPDLSSGIYRSWRPLTEDSSTAQVANIYLIDNPGDAGVSPHLLTAGSAPVPSSWSILAKAFATPKLAGASTDLSHVVFESKVDLTADTPSYPEICELTEGVVGCPRHLYESADGVVRLVGRIPVGLGTFCDDEAGPSCEAAPSSQAGIEGDYYWEKMTSSDGSRILFQTPVNPEGGRIYLREDGIRTYQVNASENPGSEPARAALWSASRDGSRDFFTTSEQLLPEDEDTSDDLYMYEVEKPAGHRLTLISIGANEGVGVVDASDNGHYVYFFASLGNLYAWHEGSLSYIGAIGNPQLNTPRTAHAGDQQQQSTARISSDGRYLLFASDNNHDLVGQGGLASPIHDGPREFYLYDSQSGRLECASCDPSGPGEFQAEISAVAGGLASGHPLNRSAALSANGRYVFFTTKDALLPEDTNGAPDAYEFDSRTGAVHLISSGTSPTGSFFINASADGRNVFFTTDQRLSGWDTDGGADLYDARIDGGLPEPLPIPASCAGESCRTAPPAPPPAPPTASRSGGPGNPSPTCPKGTRRGRRHGTVHCIKKTHKRRARKHHRRTNSHRRAGE